MILERVLDVVTKEVLPNECLTSQMDFIKTTKKPKTMNSKSWIHQLTKICNLMYFMTIKNYELSPATINQDVVDKNILIKWVIDWQKTPVYNKMKKKLGTGKPRMKDVLEALETLEDSEKIKNQIEKMKGKENRNNGNRNCDNGNSQGGGNGKCQKQGHEHLWKDCPDNPRNKNNDKCGRSRDNNQIERA